ncbi:MAG: hypothetical protein ACYCYN_07160 [Solirubrobacteraceae bacterium]
MIQQALRKLFRAPPDREAIARAQHERTLQDAQQIVQRAHTFILEALAGIDPDALEQATQGRVRAPQHRDALRALLVERTPLAAGTPLPWQLGGPLPRAVREVRGRWPQATLQMRAVLPEIGLPDPGTAALIEFLRCAADTAQAAPWLCRTDVGRDADFLAEVTRGEILRAATWPNDLHLQFRPLDVANAAVYGALSAFAAHLEANAPASSEIRA